MRIGADPKLVPNSEWEMIMRLIVPTSKALILMPIAQNVVDLIWPENERPVPVTMEAFVWTEDFAGWWRSTCVKIEKMITQGVYFYRSKMEREISLVT